MILEEMETQNPLNAAVSMIHTVPALKISPEVLRFVYHFKRCFNLKIRLGGKYSWKSGRGTAFKEQKTSFNGGLGSNFDSYHKQPNPA